MDRFDRSAQLWSLLVFAARTQQILSYKMVERLTGIDRRGVAKFLAPIQNYCEEQKLPQLQSIVIKESEGEPGKGFHKKVETDEPMFKAQARVFVFDWFRKKAPTPKDLEKAYKKKHSKGDSPKD